MTYIGKEANRLDDLAAGLVHDPDEVQAEYHPAAGTAGGETLLQLMRQIPATQLATLSWVSLRTIRAFRAGRTTLRPATREALTVAVIRYLNATLALAAPEALESAGSARLSKPAY